MITDSSSLNERLFTLEVGASYRLHIWGLSLVGFLLFVWLYHQTFLWLYERYISPESYYSHGFLIPFITGYLIYRKRERLTSICIGHSHLGLIILVAALLMHLLSVLVHVYFISGFSILLLLFGVCLFLFGREVTKSILPNLLYLIFMFPLPLLVIQKISLPLKSFVTSISVGVAHFMGVQAVKTGFIINLPDGALVIGNPCSGLRSIFSFLALGAVFVMISQISTFKKISFLLFCIPIALLSNITRVVFLIVVGNVFGSQNVVEGSFCHDFSGYAVFLIGLLMMSVVWKAFK